MLPIRKLLVLAEKGFVVLSLFLLTTALIPLLRQGPSGIIIATETDSVIQVMWVVIYCLTFLFIFVRKGKALTILKNDKFLLMTMLIIVCSVFWSSSMEQSIRRIVALLGSTYFGLYLASRFSIREILKYSAFALGLAVILSWIFALLIPSYGIATGGFEGNWRGVFTHKNHLGRYMVLSSLLFLMYSFYTVKNRLILWVFIMLSVSLVLLSTSKTALVILLAITIMIPIFRLMRLDIRLLVPTYILILFIAGVALLGFIENLNTIFEFMGKNSSLTGRTVIWSAVTDKIMERPFFGYGYAGFWTGWAGESAYVWDLAHWEVPHAHNGFLELALNFGFIGLSVFLIGFLLNLFRSIKLYSLTGSTEYLWIISLLTLLIFYSVTEIAFLQQNNIFWVLYVATVVSMRKEKVIDAIKSGVVSHNIMAVTNEQDVQRINQFVRYKNRTQIKKMMKEGNAFNLPKGSTINVVERFSKTVLVEENKSGRQGYINAKYLSK